MVGIGHPDCGDDGVGALVVRLLSRRVCGDVTLLTCRGDMLGLLNDWNGFDRVICIDAAAPAGSPGRINRFDMNEQDLPPALRMSSSHAFGLAETIALARSLGCAPRELVVIAVEGACFDVGAAMSSAVQEAGHQAADRIASELHAWSGH